ncbi:MAG: alpha/beta fold hydrolase, partial [Janthinobacterium lividum]
MFATNKTEQELEQFFDHYRKYKLTNTSSKYISSADERFSVSPNCKLIIYRQQASNAKRNAVNNVFLIVPSIFNSPEILFINSRISFVEHLKLIADVYLVDWSNVVSTNFSLESYVHEVINVLKYLHIKGMKVNLIGHCIGGTIALAAAILRSSLIKDLTLLTTPWDFSHFAPALQAYKQLNITPPQIDMPFVPKIYIKILFF